ncbi:MAG: carboxymuconolactone decarboxylase family protein [Planctomycetes bacterium]|nr:carboxymuconolactone decarboxylase family protein [Planctomycetota bacterium]
MDLDAALARPGLEPALRLQVLAAVAAVGADWALLRAVATRARALGSPRQDLEETLLQAVLFCGFPRIVTAFEELTAAWPAAVPPTGGALPREHQAGAGEALFATIYGRHADAVHDLLRLLHGELHDFVLEAAYGRILTRPHLDGRQRELLAVAMLAASAQPRQFTSHARGARHLGATREQLEQVVQTVFEAAAAGEGAAATWLQRLA